MAKKHALLNPTKRELLDAERELLGVNLTSIMDDYDLKIDSYNYNKISDLKNNISEGNDFKDMKIPGIIASIDQKISKAGNAFFIITIKDNRSSIELYCNLNLYNEFCNQMIVGKCTLFNINYRNSFLSFDKCILMDSVPFKKNSIFVIEIPRGKSTSNTKIGDFVELKNIPYNFWTNDIINYIEDNIGVFIDIGNVPVFQNTFQTNLLITPTISLIKNIKERFGVKSFVTTEDDFLWKESNKLIEFYEKNGLI